MADSKISETNRKFKVGDRVRCIDVAGNNMVELDKVYTVRGYRVPRNLPEKYGTPYIFLEEVQTFFFEDRFELVVADPVEEAKKLLEEKGYQITPPEPKQTGRVWILQGPVKPFSTTSGDKYDFGKFPILAILDWTEGQGLEKDDTV